MDSSDADIGVLTIPRSSFAPQKPLLNPKYVETSIYKASWPKMQLKETKPMKIEQNSDIFLPN